MMPCPRLTELLQDNQTQLRPLFGCEVRGPLAFWVFLNAKLQTFAVEAIDAAIDLSFARAENVTKIEGLGASRRVDREAELLGGALAFVDQDRIPLETNNQV